MHGLAPAQGDHEGRPYEDICPNSSEWYAQIAAFSLPACDAASLHRRLYDKYRVEVPVIQWNGRQFVRVSVQGYNTEEDAETLVGALEALLPWSYALYKKSS